MGLLEKTALALEERPGTMSNISRCWVNTRHALWPEGGGVMVVVIVVHGGDERGLVVVVLTLNGFCRP